MLAKKQSEQEGMSLSCCSSACVSASLRASSIPDICLSSTRSTSLTSSFPLPLSTPLRNLPASLYLPSLSSHTWKPAWLVPVSGTSFTMRTFGTEGRKSRASRKRNNRTHTHTHTRCYTDWFPVRGPQRVTGGEGLVTLILHWLPVSWRLLEDACKHKDPLRVGVRAYFILSFWFREVPGLQPLAKGLPDSAFSPVRWNTARGFPYN